MEEGKVRLACGSRKWKNAQSVKKAKAMRQMLKTRKANRPAWAHTVLVPESASSSATVGWELGRTGTGVQPAVAIVAAAELGC